MLHTPLEHLPKGFPCATDDESKNYQPIFVQSCRYGVIMSEFWKPTPEQLESKIVFLDYKDVQPSKQDQLLVHWIDKTQRVIAHSLSQTYKCFLCETEHSRKRLQQEMDRIKMFSAASTELSNHE